MPCAAGSSGVNCLSGGTAARMMCPLSVKITDWVFFPLVTSISSPLLFALLDDILVIFRFLGFYGEASPAFLDAARDRLRGEGGQDNVPGIRKYCRPFVISTRRPLFFPSLIDAGRGVQLARQWQLPCSLPGCCQSRYGLIRYSLH